MTGLVIDNALRSEGAFAPEAERVPIHAALAVVVLAGFVQGAVMGSHDGRVLQALYSGLKVPLLLLVTTALCMPSSYALHLGLGLRRDFAAACRACFTVQAIAALCLAASAPWIAFVYVGSTSYPVATCINGLAYFGAALTAQHALARHYAPLIARDARHRVVLLVWPCLYVGVAIQLAWTLRPFIGWPDVAPALFRGEAWGNAYVHVIDAVTKALR